MIQSCNRHAISSNVSKPSDGNVCHTNVSYKVKSMPEKKALLAGYLIPFYDLENRATKKHNS